MKLKQTFILTAFFAGLAIPAQAASIMVDGNLSDWGLHKDGKPSDWLPNAGMGPVRYTLEDQTGYASSRLYPGYGGQAYDAEALYAYMNNTHLYLALITGLSPNTPDDPRHNSYGPGDFAIDFGRDGSFEFGIETTGGNAGKLYEVTSWNYGIWNSLGQHDPKHPDPKHPTSIQVATLIGAVGELAYGSTPFTQMGIHAADKHYALELAIPLSGFAGFSGDFDVHWTMNCANDAISVSAELATVPEPGSLILLALGFLTLAMMLRRRSKPILSSVCEEPQFQMTRPRSRFSSAKLLRRDIRNNTTLFKFLHQRKYCLL